jgi:hypothetical protein
VRGHHLRARRARLSLIRPEWSHGWGPLQIGQHKTI